MGLTASEHAEQAALFERAAWHVGRWPELELLFAVPNGQYRRGQRPEPGIKAGVPDLCLPVARGGYHGLFIELKTAAGRVKKAQIEFMRGAEEQGYFVCVCRGADTAWAVLVRYLEAGNVPGGWAPQNGPCAAA